MHYRCVVKIVLVYLRLLPVSNYRREKIEWWQRYENQEKMSISSQKISIQAWGLGGKIRTIIWGQRIYALHIVIRYLVLIMCYHSLIRWDSVGHMDVVGVMYLSCGELPYIIYVIWPNGIGINKSPYYLGK